MHGGKGLVKTLKGCCELLNVLGCRDVVLVVFWMFLDGAVEVGCDAVLCLLRPL